MNTPIERDSIPAAVSSTAHAGLPVGVHGMADPRFNAVVRTFARVFAGRPANGGALAISIHGEPVVDIWAGAADAAGKPWTSDTGTIIYSASKGVSATVLARLADRGLLDYYAPVCEYWPEFAANGKKTITIEQVLSHRAGLSSLPAKNVEEFLDHELMEQRMAAAKPDHLLGKPIYHGLTIGWLMAGIARSITGRSMAELYRTEVADPLQTDGIHLGRPPQDAPTVAADLVGSVKNLVDRRAISPWVAARLLRLPPPLRAPAAMVYAPGMETVFVGEHPTLFDTQLPSGNGVCTARAVARMYSALACDGLVDGQRYLSAGTVRELERVRTFRLDRITLVPFWHLGYHSLPIPRAPRGYGHLGAFGSGGWVDPRSGMSVGFVHNRMAFPWATMDNLLLVRLTHEALRAIRPPAARSGLVWTRRKFRPTMDNRAS